ncbi:MAG: hypothetical protein E7434_01485 [Ruminococcaceae bacterium]|nr:hypothetical protein [Oscillospiraceae bacterium]
MRVFDGHCDTAFELWRRNEALANNTCHIDLGKITQFEAYAQVFAFCSMAGTSLATRQLLKEPLEVLRQNVQKFDQHIAFAETAIQISSLHEKKKAAALLSLEGAELIDCSIERLPALRADGFRICTLTWNADNMLAGCHLGNEGLSAKGADFVRMAQKLGIYIDVSHLGERAFWNLAEITQKPILASHSNCRSLCNHSRNLTDDQLSLIAQTGGTVGLNLYVPFLGENADFSTLRRHLEHMLRLCGEDHVALGGDLDGCDVLPKGFIHVGNYVDFYDYLSSCGYGAALLDKIFYQNLLELF